VGGDGPWAEHRALDDAHAGEGAVSMVGSGRRSPGGSLLASASGALRRGGAGCAGESFTCGRIWLH
jgi:hypothetical protein